MQDPDQAKLSANKARILSQLLSGLCRGLKEQVIEKRLVRASEWAQGGGQGESEHEVRDGQQKLLLSLEPYLGFIVLALGAVTVAAGVVAELGLVALGAGIGLSTQSWCAALLNGMHGLSVAGEQAVGVLLAISGAELAEDVGQF